MRNRRTKLRAMLHTIILVTVWTVMIALTGESAQGGEPHAKQAVSLKQYVSALTPENNVSISRTSGSLWTDDSPIAGLANDAKARRLHDLITIAVSEQTLAQAAGDVTAQRDYAASSGLSALGGRINTAGVSELFSPHSSTALKGKGASNSNSLLRTTLAGEVVAVFPNGNMVVEASRSVTMNNERRTFILRGVVRPVDVNPSNVVSSAAMAHLEVELKGKGVVSDGTRPNNIGIRWLWKILGF